MSWTCPRMTGNTAQRVLTGPNTVGREEVQKLLELLVSLQKQEKETNPQSNVC